MKVGIMQPYFLPYIGYFQLIQQVDLFVVYDDVQYIKGGYINRNACLQNGQRANFILPIKNGHFEAPINERFFVDAIERDWAKFRKTIDLAYGRAPHYKDVIRCIEAMEQLDKKASIAHFTTETLKIICSYLEIKTPFVLSSDLVKENTLRGEEKVIHIVKLLGGDTYINSYGGYALYQKEHFAKEELDLLFFKPVLKPYRQFKEPFVPSLSVIDVMMFNDKEMIQQMLQSYEVIRQ